ncbi:MAG: lysine biosynthesis protein LysX [Jatrophihabitantaceae bacterium]
MSTTSTARPVAVLASRVRVDEKRIFAALDRRAVRYVQLDSRELRLADRAGRPAWSVVLNREISLSRAVHAARTLESWGVPVLNPAAAIEVCGNNWRTTLALREHGVPTPRASLALTPGAALQIMTEMGFPVVVKPVTGSWGRLVTPVYDRATAELVVEYIAALAGPESHLVYVQDLIEKPDRDLRVIVIGGRAVGAIYRRSAGWRTNVARGGEALPCPLTDELARLACAAASAVGAGIAGVDLIECADGSLSVLEVNHGVEFSGFQLAHGESIDLADQLVGYLIECAELEAARPSDRPVPDELVASR